MEKIEARKVYECPSLIEIGSMEEITETFGWGGGRRWGGHHHWWGGHHHWRGGHGSKGDGHPNSPDS